MGRIIFSFISVSSLLTGLVTPVAVMAEDPALINPAFMAFQASPANAEQIKQEIRDRMMRLPPQDRAAVWKEVSPTRSIPPGFGPAMSGTWSRGFGQGYESRIPTYQAPRR